jgi:hypothetical protein
MRENISSGYIDRNLRCPKCGLLIDTMMLRMCRTPPEIVDFLRQVSTQAGRIVSFDQQETIPANERNFWNPKLGEKNGMLYSTITVPFPAQPTPTPKRKPPVTAPREPHKRRFNLEDL